VFYGGLTYNSHPLSCAAALAAIQVMEDDDLVGNAHRLEPVMRRHHEELADRHPSVGLHRNIGLFGILELVEDRDTMKPLSPYNVTTRRWWRSSALLERGVFLLIVGRHSATPILHHGAAQGGVSGVDAALKDRRPRNSTPDSGRTPAAEKPRMHHSYRALLAAAADRAARRARGLPRALTARRCMHDRGTAAATRCRGRQSAM
jgi:hypothetical protein